MIYIEKEYCNVPSGMFRMYLYDNAELKGKPLTMTVGYNDNDIENFCIQHYPEQHFVVQKEGQDMPTAEDLWVQKSLRGAFRA